MSIEVLKPGAFSTFQDLGRWGTQLLGVPVSGPMDPISHRIANRVLGNPADEASLEITLLGPSLRFELDAVVAWCGADMSVTLEGIPIPRATAAEVPAGATLAFGRRISGLRTYLALRGGFLLDRVLGSCSTHVRAGLGGYRGRPLRKGDQLQFNSLTAIGHEGHEVLPRRAADSISVNEWLDAQPAREAPIRLMPGREWPQFSGDAHRALFDTPWRIGAQSERMGYRLEGLPLLRTTRNDVLSEAVSFGAMQVPPDGHPIVLMADRQTTGGYPKIAQVASVDLPRLAQRAPGESVLFELLTVEEAQRLLVQREEQLLWLDV